MDRLFTPLPRRLRVAVDTAEKKPWPFPKSLCFRDTSIRVEVERVPLYAGDYQIALGGQSHTESTIVERKGSISELYKNVFTADRRRFLAALDKLVSSTKRPVIALNFKVTQVFTPTPLVREPEKVLDKLYEYAAERGIPIMWLPPTPIPIHNGEVLLRWMLTQAALDCYTQTVGGTNGDPAKR